MAIEYIINHNCPAKDELGAEGIMHLVKSKGRAEILLERFIKDGMPREEALHATFGVQVRRPTGEEEMKRTTVAQLLREAELLIDHEPACKSCPVSFGRSFGCYGSINYPISEKAEEWLANLAAKAVTEGMPNSILIKFMLDQQVDGQTFKQMRGGEGIGYFESKLPIEVEIEDDVLGNAIIDTNQIMEMFFGVGEMKDVHQQFLLFFSGGLTLQDTPPDEDRIGVEIQIAVVEDQFGATRFWVYKMPDELSDDHTTRQIKAFLRSVFEAFCAQASVSVDG